MANIAQLQRLILPSYVPARLASDFRRIWNVEFNKASRFVSETAAAKSAFFKANSFLRRSGIVLAKHSGNGYQMASAPQAGVERKRSR